MTAQCQLPQLMIFLKWIMDLNVRSCLPPPSPIWREPETAAQCWAHGLESLVFLLSNLHPHSRPTVGLIPVTMSGKLWSLQWTLRSNWGVCAAALQTELCLGLISCLPGEVELVSDGVWCIPYPRQIRFL